MRFTTTHVVPRELDKLEDAPTVAGSPSRSCLPAWWSSPEHENLSLTRVWHQGEADVGPPLFHRRIHCCCPSLAPTVGGGCVRFDPDAPVRKAGVAENRCGQTAAVPIRLFSRAWRHENSLKGPNLRCRRARINRHQAAGNPTPRAIRVAIKGIDAKPTNSTLMIQPRRVARASLTWGSSPFRRGMAQRM